MLKEGKEWEKGKNADELVGLKPEWKCKEQDYETYAYMIYG